MNYTFRSHKDLAGNESSARYSLCEMYRYTLERTWAHDMSFVSFIGLNPSTATELENDPTVRRCIGFAQDWGMGGMRMLNAFALRSTDPRGLKLVDDPVGDQNDDWLVATARDSAFVVACWGTHATLNNRHEAVLKLLRDANIKLMCLGVTMGGYPKHPLYLKADLRPVPYR